MSTFTNKLAAVAEGQFDQFNMFHEADPKLTAQIKRYWTELGFQFESVEVAWSAVFVSWCVQKAGATKADFKFHPAHAGFVHDAIHKPRAYSGEPFDKSPIAVGDILQNNRDGGRFDFAHASAHDQYFSHSAIVIEVGADGGGPYAMTVGGNEANSVGRKRVGLTAAGKVKQRASSSYIALLKCLK